MGRCMGFTDAGYHHPLRRQGTARPAHWRRLCARDDHAYQQRAGIPRRDPSILEQGLARAHDTSLPLSKTYGIGLWHFHQRSLSKQQTLLLYALPGGKATGGNGGADAALLRSDDAPKESLILLGQGAHSSLPRPVRSRQHRQKACWNGFYPPWPCILMAPRCGSILPSFACPGGARRLADLLSYRAARNRARVSIQRQLATICRRGRRIRPAVCRRIGRPALPISLPCCHGARQGRRFPGLADLSSQAQAPTYPGLPGIPYRIARPTRRSAAPICIPPCKRSIWPKPKPWKGTGTGPHLSLPKVPLPKPRPMRWIFLSSYGLPTPRWPAVSYPPVRYCGNSHLSCGCPPISSRRHTVG